MNFKKIVGNLFGVLILVWMQPTLAQVEGEYQDLPDTHKKYIVAKVYKKLDDRRLEIGKNYANRAFKLKYLLGGEEKTDYFGKTTGIDSGYSLKHIELYKNGITVKSFTPNPPIDNNLYKATLELKKGNLTYIKESTMFPKNWNAEEIEGDGYSVAWVVNNVPESVRQKIPDNGKFVTKSYSGFWVKVFIDQKWDLAQYKQRQATGRINFYPIFEPNENDFVFIPENWN